ncbi:uncharacterized protein BO88DRAFT_339698 [Aspergillus vadensis CBS 113365]|uniref:BZIP transcription factor n=1 Tax=Aspergillus vadensis (strain CBS 113365 / IMI 142717 / IBT 24658) TaxID=1448311 RepID=A0A319BBG0_ASPVC|nr:hypothetical protein BO88DRAFT_339698 [Aspergillus vadensis CBS 113365]PYH69689.1 hypothetical protein BO88DRAFT_339698 [Aspergillus vadensis CBS 113365]
MSPTPEPPTAKKRESRAGARKVTSLSAEQLERKRANDREAQRTIRQRTKEHIERLEHQVAELKAKGEQFDDVVRRNVALEHEIRALKHQLALAGRQGYPGMEGTYSNAPGSMLPATQFAEPLGMNPASRAPSVISTSSRVSVGSEWPPYGTNRSPSTCESSEANYGNRAEPYLFENQLQPASTMSVAPPQVSYSAPVGAQPDPTFQSYAQAYHTGNAPRGPVDDLAPHPPQPVHYVPGQRPMSVPTIPTERPAGYSLVHAPQPYHQHTLPPQTRNDYSYAWNPHQS